MLASLHKAIAHTPSDPYNNTFFFASGTISGMSNYFNVPVKVEQISDDSFSATIPSRWQ